MFADYTAKSFAFKGGKIACMSSMGEIVAKWRLSQRPKLSRPALARLVNTSRQNIDNLENGVSDTPRDYLKDLARVMGYSRMEDLIDGRDPPTDGVAQIVSQPRHTLLPQLSWEQVVGGTDLPEVFMTEAPDDAMAPIARRGRVIVWSTKRSISPGCGVLVKDRDGRYFVRQLHQGRDPSHFRAVPSNPAYATLDSIDDALVVVAVWHGLLGGLEELP